MTHTKNPRIEEFKINLCSDYGLEAYFQDILSYSMMDMKKVGLLDQLKYDSFEMIEYNYIQAASLIFYETSNVVLGEEYLRSISKNKAEIIKDYPNVLEDFNSFKQTLTKEIKLWNSTNRLIQNEERFVFDVLHFAYSTTGVIIRNSKNDFENQDNDGLVLGVAELPNYGHTNSDRGCIQIFLNVSGVLKKINNYGKQEIFIPDLEYCLKANGFEILKLAPQFVLAEANKKTLNFIPAKETVAIEEYYDTIWYDKNKNLRESLRYNFGGSFLLKLVDNGIVTLFYDSDRKVKVEAKN